ncbi:hypothetical protein BD779DRAFT_1801043 [Infundibulicybe gibba]|nr:hypothetical protein BD779DRAFT_1801043 [Infundibulicybe gibba]
MPGLLSLANELIRNISDELDTRKVFRGTCRRINAVVSPRVFSYITIDIHRDRLNTGISQLEALATQSTHIAEYVRTIDIRHLTPDYSPYPHRTYKLFGSERIFSIETEHRELEVEWGRKKMRELLPKALAALKGITTAMWMACGPSPDWALVLVSQFLGALPGLDTLHITTPLGKPELHLNRISNLTKLTVKNDHDTTISEIIANSPYLTHLNICGDKSEVTDHTPTLHSLLGKVPLGQPLRLEHLSIDCYCVGSTTKHSRTSAI